MAEGLLDDYRDFVTEAQEQSETTRKRAEKAETQLENELQRALKFAEKLRSLGIDPDAA